MTFSTLGQRSSGWLAIIGMVFAAVACTGAGAERSSSPTPSSTPTPIASLASTPSEPSSSPTNSGLVKAQAIDAPGAARLTMTADWMAIAGGSVWAAAGIGIERLDPRDGSLLSSISVRNGVCLGFDVAFGSVWAGAPGEASPSVVRIDAATGKVVATIPLKVAGIQCESSVGAGDGAVWVISRAPGRVLMKIDPTTNAVTATFPMPPEDPQGQQPWAGDYGGVRAGYGGVWIADQGHDALLRVSPADGSIGARVALGPASGPRFLAVGEGSVWVLNQTNGTVSRVDPNTNSVVATVRVSSMSVDGGDIAVGCGAVWARVSDELVARIDPATNAVVARYGPPAGSGSVACGDGTVWISAHDVSAVWRLPVR